MENLFFFLATSLVLRIPHPKFKRYSVGDSGCSSLLAATGGGVHSRCTADGDKIYFSDHEISGVSYGLITVAMKNAYSLKLAETILEQYIDKARKPFKITYSAGRNTVLTESWISITDYWQDCNGVDWKIKGYANEQIVTVLYVKNITAATVAEHDAFLNGFRFSSSSHKIK